jgi:hypothetical protein
VQWISGKNNPAEEWTTASGYKNWRDTFEALKKKIEPIIDEPKDDSISELQVLNGYVNVRKIRGINTDTFTRLNYSKINDDYYWELISNSAILDKDKIKLKHIEPNVYDYYQYKIDDELKIQEKFIDKYKSNFVFGKWLSETEKLFWLKTIDFCFEKSLLKNVFKNNKNEVIISIGAAGKKGTMGYFTIHDKKNIVQLNNLRRKDKIIRLYERYEVSGIGAIFHEVSHFTDIVLFKYTKENKISEKQKKQFIEKIKDIYPKAYKDFAKKKAYFLNDMEIFARISEMILKEQFILNNYKNIDDYQITDDYHIAGNSKSIIGSKWDANLNNDLVKIIYIETFIHFEQYQKFYEQFY